MKTLLCIVATCACSLLYGSDPARAFDGFTENLVAKGFARLPEPQWPSYASPKQPLWWSHLQKGDLKIRVEARLHPSAAEAQRYRVYSRQQSAAHHYEVKGLQSPGVEFHAVGCPYTFRAGIAEGRVSVLYYLSTKNPGGAPDDRAINNPEIRLLLRTLAIDLQKRAGKAAKHS